ncbi:transposable element Tcb1 transposase [Trichonephila clavipes]|nr:transposable element Tcb1 transposase [Trichonephila clavipes]
MQEALRLLALADAQRFTLHLSVGATVFFLEARPSALSAILQLFSTFTSSKSRPSGIVISDAGCCAVGPGRRAASLLVRLMVGDERWEAPDPPPGCFPSKLGWNRATSYCHLYGAQGYGQRQAEIGSRVGRNQTTVMRICDRWRQEGTTDRRGQSHPPQCTTSREDRTIVHVSVTHPSVTSRTVAQHIMHHHTGPAPGIMVWGGIGYHSRTPLVRISGTLNSQLSFLTFRAWPQPYFNRIMHDHTWHALSKYSSSITRLNCFPGRLALRICRRWKTCGPRLLNDLPRLHPQLPHQINFGNVWKLLGLLYPKNTSKVPLNQCRGVWQW